MADTDRDEQTGRKTVTVYGGCASARKTNCGVGALIRAYK